MRRVRDESEDEHSDATNQEKHTAWKSDLTLAPEPCPEQNEIEGKPVHHRQGPKQPDAGQRDANARDASHNSKIHGKEGHQPHQSAGRELKSIHKTPLQSTPHSALTLGQMRIPAQQPTLLPAPAQRRCPRPPLCPRSAMDAPRRLLTQNQIHAQADRGEPYTRLARPAQGYWLPLPPGEGWGEG